MGFVARLPARSLLWYIKQKHKYTVYIQQLWSGDIARTRSTHEKANSSQFALPHSSLLLTKMKGLSMAAILCMFAWRKACYQTPRTMRDEGQKVQQEEGGERSPTRSIGVLYLYVYILSTSITKTARFCRICRRWRTILSIYSLCAQCPPPFHESTPTRDTFNLWCVGVCITHPPRPPTSSIGCFSDE